MNRNVIIAAFFALVFIAGQNALAQSGHDLLQKGLIQERVNGDLDEAIKVYERIIVKFPNDRPVAAQALLHIGLCYEKLGKQEALKHYQYLIKEYGDQMEPVAQARARLTELGHATNKATMSTRQVWAPAIDTMGSPSPNGRYLTYVNWTNGNLAVHDFKTGENRELTDEGTWDTPSQFCDVSIWSPDSRQIAYCWIDTGEGTDLRIVGIDGSEPRILYDEPESGYAWPRAWSHDGKHILAVFCNRDAPKATGHLDKIALVSIADGSMRVLKSQGNRRSRFMNFSPDDRYIVFDLETSEGSQTHDIHLMAIDGSRETLLVEHPANDGAPFWTPDGKHIVFMSDRSGSWDLWMLDVTKGKPQGAPIMVKGMGEKVSPIGLTPDGSFYYSVETPAFDIYSTTVDFAANKLLAPPAKMSLRFEGWNYAPFWSPDGKYLAYASRRSSGVVLVIRSIESGEERDLSIETVEPAQKMGWVAPRWSPDGNSILITAFDRKRSNGLYLIDVETGDVTPIVQEKPENKGNEYVPAFWPVFSNDGKQIYYIRDRSIMTRNLKTHRERELYQANTYIYRLALSPDGGRLAFTEATKALRPNMVKTIATSGGEPSELYTLKEGNRFSWGVGLSWTPDGAHVIVGKPDGPDKPDELWMIPTKGGEPRKLELGVKVNHMSLHPDGRRIAFACYESSSGGEVWVMENFLPESTASK